jgi:hypothetical protein
MIPPRQCAIDELYARTFGSAGQPKEGVTSELADLPTDEQIIAATCSQPDGDRIARLWDGDWRGFRSQSEADFALCAALVRTIPGDPALVEAAVIRLFRQSGLFRPDKGDRPRMRSGASYVQQTARAAMAHVHRPPIIAPPHMEASAPNSLDAPDPSLALPAHLQEQAAALRAERSAVMAVLRNPRLKTERVTALAVSFEYFSAASRGSLEPDGFARTPLARVGEQAGISAKRAGVHVKRLAAWGVVERRYARSMVQGPDFHSGEIRWQPRLELYVWLPRPLLATLHLLAQLVPPRDAVWGGKRLRCPEHPHAAVVATLRCVVCNRVLSESTSSPAGGGGFDGPT